ncbi:nuclear transport factor 2 family protein [Ramlibacter albus]|uniref:Nuclear transport factor 2 family protein n=1 Tax=Ramlibacter albus TaxID=2079448 RepID=A0A923M995_9BURK|nr:nuclear transport factor 2 family protein [Ramlibacter albus]MBC5765236.1 nuclear transport factor 2 family protein [Ramlibacter albus]
MKADSVTHLVAMFESMAPHDVPRLARWYTDDAWFKDPFNDVRGLAAIQRIYAHMFEALESPRFTVVSQVVQADECALMWEFRFRRRGETMVIRGASHLLLAADGRIESHRDYWDPAEELYEKLPLLGAFMRWLKRRLQAT